MTILTASQLFIRRALLGLISLLCLLGLLGCIAIGFFYLVTPSIANGYYAQYLAPIISISGSEGWGIGVGAALSLLTVFFGRLKSYFQPIPKRAYSDIERMCQLVKSVRDFVQGIRDTRAYITQGERAHILDLYLRVAKEEEAKLIVICRYPNGEELSSGLEYV